jgi:transposase
MIRSPDHKFDLRLRMAKHAKTHSIRDAARVFACSRNTVRLWLRRFEAGGRSALRERSRAPKSCPHRTSPHQEKRILAARDQAPCFGPRRLKLLFGLRPSTGAIARVLRQNGRTRKPRRRGHRKNDLRAVKQAYRAFERLQADTKPLFDIPAYWPQMTEHRLPRHQYTHRDVKTGALFTDYADELSTTYAALSTRRLIQHLARFGLDPATVTLSTDNGSEYGGTDRHVRQRGYHAVVQSELVTHRFLPPRTPNAHADVESSHALIEHELFDLERFTSRAEFFEKVATYQRWFNFARPNFSKGGPTPAQILEAQGLDPRLLLLTPTDLDAHFRHDPKGLGVGHYLPVAPENGERRSGHTRFSASTGAEAGPRLPP